MKKKWRRVRKEKKWEEGKERGEEIVEVEGDKNELEKERKLREAQ